MRIRPLFDLKSATAPLERGRSLSCVSCGLHKGVLSPRMVPYGENRLGVMTVGEGPGEIEDRDGAPWRGRTGRLLQDTFHDFGFDLVRDCISLNAVNCRPPKNRAPTSFEISCCREVKVTPALLQYNPRVILLLGGSAVASVLGPLCSNALGDSVGKWRGFAIPIPEWGAWVCPTYHPSYIARENRAEVTTVWRQDIKRGLDLLDAPVPASENLRDKVIALHNETDILKAIYKAHEAKFVSYDYETTGLRPNLHKIICASFATSEDQAFAFMMPDKGPIPGAWKALMARSKVGKISHNMKFENDWTLEHFEVEKINWVWDSMIAAHVVDNRVGICGLKLQGFLNFGLQSWDDLIAPFLRSVNERDPSSPNRILEFIDQYGPDECLIYCGIDSLVAFRLAMKQMQEIGSLDGVKNENN